MKKNKLLYIVGALIIVLVLGVIGYFTYHYFKSNDDKPNEIVKLSTIEGYDYNLEDRDTKIFKEHFEHLSTVLKNDPIDYEGYAKDLACLYIIDLYTISNKLNKYDVGGSEYVYDEGKDNYILNVEDTLYKYVENNTNGKRNQELPEVTEVEVINIDEKTIKVLDDKYEGYTIEVSWNYKEDLGYDTNATIEIAKIDNKLYVISQSVSE